MNLSFCHIVIVNEMLKKYCKLAQIITKICLVFKPHFELDTTTLSVLLVLQNYSKRGFHVYCYYKTAAMSTNLAESSQ